MPTKRTTKSSKSTRKSPVTSKVAGELLTKKPTDNMVNHIALVIDESGSMGSIREAALEAFNDQLAVIREQAVNENQKTTVSIIKFDTSVTKYLSSELVENVKDLRDYRPAGGTAMMDAVGVAVKELESIRTKPSEDVSYLLILVTDGEENSSRTYNTNTISQLIKDRQKTDRWSFVFSVPQGHKSVVQSFLGVPDGNVTEWEQSTKGVQTLSASMSIGTRSFYQRRTLGHTSTKNYFTTDLSKVNPNDIKSLDILNQGFRKLKVTKEENIRSFVEGEGYSFEKGKGFYQLTKPEDVQDYKELVIMDKSNGKLYGGADARKILGMPATGTTRVKPGNHMNYEIFVKSTSVNRILVRGTTLLYDVR